ncbi:MAG: hypothetical protein ACOYEB_09845, partial [Enterococcus lemanii]
MEKVEYAKMNPNKNTTILVLNRFSRHQYSDLANQLMQSESVFAEQVGFVENTSDPNALCRLYMMGGEFCANATASLCAYQAYQHNLRDGYVKYLQIEVSGADDLLKCEVRRYGDAFRVQVSMPLPLYIRDENLTFQGKRIEYGVVEYPGICHAIIFDKVQGEQSRMIAQHVVHKGLLDKQYSAKGATLFSKNKQNILPLIYVETTDTEVWESSCGSASAALATYLAYKHTKN